VYGSQNKQQFFFLLSIKNLCLQVQSRRWVFTVLYKHLNTIQVNFIIQLILHKAPITSKMTSTSPDWKCRQIIFLMQCLQNTILRSTDSYLNVYIDPRFACGFPNSVSSRFNRKNTRQHSEVNQNHDKSIFATWNTIYLRGLNLAPASLTSQYALKPLA
jgi:hypothetical protein